MGAVLDRVEIEIDGAGRQIVVPYWANVDRPVTQKFNCGFKPKLAERLQRAWEDGAAYEYAQLRHDVNYNSYIACDSKVLMRIANADLKRLGY